MSGAHPPYYRKTVTHNARIGSRYYLCIYFPEWSIDVTRRKLRALNPPCDPAAIVLTGSVSGQRVVARACPVARQAGVATDMTLQLAKALISSTSVYYEEYNPTRDIEALHTLAVWCLRFSPHVGLDTELCGSRHAAPHTMQMKNESSCISHLHYGIVIDLTGTTRLHGDLESLSHSIHDLFKGSARVALAPTIGAVWALSRFGNISPHIIHSIPALRDVVRDLPLSALRIDDTSRSLLGDVGIFTIGELLELPRHSLSHRFGRQVVCRLAQLLGGLEESFYTVKPTKRYIQRRVFEPPLANKMAVAAAIGALFNKLINSLRASGTVAKLFSLTLTDTTGHSLHKEFPLASASNDQKHLSTILQPIIDSMRFCGELREMLLEAHEVVGMQTEQESFSSPHDNDSNNLSRSRGELLNSFSVRIGKERIAYARLRHSHIPEIACAYQSFRETPTLTRVNDITPHYGSLERPPVLFVPPEPITTIAMLPDKPPSWIRWRGSNLTIVSGIGPERIAPEWWRKDLQRDEFTERDYFRIQDNSGRWLWIYREVATQKWFAHGVWR